MTSVSVPRPAGITGLFAAALAHDGAIKLSEGRSEAEPPEARRTADWSMSKEQEQTEEDDEDE